MARRRVYLAHEVPKGVVDMVRMICADYDRRARELERGVLSDNVGCEYVRLNDAVESALESIDPNLRQDFLSDIGYRRGYDFAQVSPYLAKNTYYARKRKFIYDVAKSLFLVE